METKYTSVPNYFQMYILQEPPDLSSVHCGLQYETCSDFLGQFCSGQCNTDIQFVWCQSATKLPDVLPKTTMSPSASLTTAKTISQLQDTEDGKITATPSTTPSYSSIILPVVIALIVITLLVFTLVGLYRMCWKRDPGTPENGNDQPQSDKESVKLLTVKTISHESGFSFSF
ncbi:hypothetical protein STEG23_001809 [Scotinomys teguina]